jgi:hypothetical protein
MAKPLGGANKPTSAGYGQPSGSMSFRPTKKKAKKKK